MYPLAGTCNVYTMAIRIEGPDVAPACLKVGKWVTNVQKAGSHAKLFNLSLMLVRTSVAEALIQTAMIFTTH